ncbi:hypothetical protein [Polyangium jinanense]|uniref:Uncharacterized protein n=1 Tax=Polyangium jinanense TaxID=2829994 RepID=A0A9X3XA15_9BACT|nr:hypothetical protein [Polyangium jinanense]MDC3954312.1 hypothetical protein [Polyangium jinanense]MDC3984236.1 hypothetical protein [Polyangium jinanense]
MNERPKSAGLRVPLLAAASVLTLAFGGGVLFGWATRERKPKAPETSAASAPDPQEVKRELKACRREWAELSRPRVIPTVVPTAGEANDAGAESPAKVEALEKEVQECRVRATLVNAHVCGTMMDHITMLSVFMNHSGCVETGGVDEYMVNSFDKCAEFEDFPGHLDEDEINKGERIRLAESESNRRLMSREKMERWRDSVVSECRKRNVLPSE